MRARTAPRAVKMSFFGDQYTFATWVYAVASGNMMFCIVLSWATFR